LVAIDLGCEGIFMWVGGSCWNWWIVDRREYWPPFEEMVEDVDVRVRESGGMELPTIAMYEVGAWWIGWIDAGFDGAHIFS